LVASVMLYMTFSDFRHWVHDAQAERAAATAKP
jgi:hypothetical protein